eukprot:s2078_g7.t1
MLGPLPLSWTAVRPMHVIHQRDERIAAKFRYAPPPPCARTRLVCLGRIDGGLQGSALYHREAGDVAQMLLQKKKGKPYSHRPQIKLVPTVFQQLRVRWREQVIAQKQHPASSAGFNLLVLVMILVNTVVIGIEVDLQRSRDLEARSYWFAIEALFALFFGVECLMRVHQLGVDYFLEALLQRAG